LAYQQRILPANYGVPGEVIQRKGRGDEMSDADITQIEKMVADGPVDVTGPGVAEGTKIIASHRVRGVTIFTLSNPIFQDKIETSIPRTHSANAPHLYDKRGLCAIREHNTMFCNKYSYYQRLTLMVRGFFRAKGRFDR
jgi:hypothetical protein